MLNGKLTENEAIAYAQLALLTVQASANRYTLLKDIRIDDLRDELLIMFHLYPQETVEREVRRQIIIRR